MAANANNPRLTEHLLECYRFPLSCEICDYCRERGTLNTYEIIFADGTKYDDIEADSFVNARQKGEERWQEQNPNQKLCRVVGLLVRS